jgi:hypothetical protein
MKKIISAVVVAVAVGIAAAPASADNSGTPPGPPFFSGNFGGGTAVTHCQFFGGHSAVVTNKNGDHGGCS